MSKKQRDTSNSADPTPASAKAEDAAEAKDPRPPQRRGLRGGRPEVEERVLTEARMLFAEMDYDGVTVRTIASRAGVSHALVHRYFGSKNDILAVVLRRNEEWIAGQAVGAGTLRETALAMLRRIRRERPDYFKLVARLAMSGLPQDMPRPDFPATTRLLEVAEQEAGELAEGGASLRRRALVAAVVVLAVGWTAFEDLLLPVTGLDEAGDQQVDAALERAVACLVDHYGSEWPT